MRIIQLITRQQRRGAEIFASQLAQKLIEKGHEVLVVSVYRGEAKLPFFRKMETLDARTSWRGVDPKAWKRLDALIREFQPDILQANASETLKYAAISKKLLGWNTPLVYRNANKISGFLDGKAKLFFNRWLMTEVKAVISVSEATLSDFSSIFKVKHQVSIPIGIDTAVISKSLSLTASRIIEGEYLVFIGGLVPEKDPFGMLEIFERINKNFPELHLVYVGSGPLEQALSTAINQKGLGEKVRMLANQENIFPLLSGAKALVMPSKIEGLPAVILEAMYCRIPVIAYEVGGIGEVLQRKETGWAVPAGDRLAFEAAVLDCLNLPAIELEKITELAKKRVEERYELDEVVAAFEAYYKELIVGA